MKGHHKSDSATTTTTAAAAAAASSPAAASSSPATHSRRHRRLLKFSFFSKLSNASRHHHNSKDSPSTSPTTKQPPNQSKDLLPSGGNDGASSSSSSHPHDTFPPVTASPQLGPTTTPTTPNTKTHRDKAPPVKQNRTAGNHPPSLVVPPPVIEINGNISNDSEDEPIGTLNLHVSNKQTKWAKPQHLGGSDSLHNPIYNPRRGSLFIHRHSDDQIVTPFAQVLSSLRKVKANFAHIANSLPSSSVQSGTTGLLPEENATHTVSASSAPPQPPPLLLPQTEEKNLVKDALRELEWCLEQLETIQTYRSVSDMATNKFRKLLNKELSQFSEEKTGMQISQYLTSTFLDNDSLSAEIKSDEDMESFHDDNNTLEKVEEEELENSKTSPLDSGSSGNLLEEGETMDVPTKSTTTAAPSAGVVGSSQSTLTDGSDTYRRSLDPLDSSRLKNRRLSPATDLEISACENMDTMLDSLPPYGVTCVNVEEIADIMDTSLDCWGIDIFKVAELTNNRPLTCVTYTIFKKRGFLHKFEIDPRCVLRYMCLVEEHYRSDTPYHNSIHAADVTQSTHVLLLAQALNNVFTDLELLSALYACAIHDVNHPGLTNQYLVNTNDRLAVLYNDSSVLENHHLAVAFSLLREKDCDIFSNLSKKQRLTLRRMVIDMVLATDMSKHMSLLADLKTMVETKKVAGSGILNLDNYNDKIQILQNMVHCADLSNPTKPLRLYCEWTARIMEEFFLQGDKERAAGLDISPMCDRDTASIEKSQVSFIDFIAHPLWETWSDLVHPDAQEIFDMLQENRDWYCCKLDPASTKDPTNVHHD